MTLSLQNTSPSHYDCVQKEAGADVSGKATVLLILVFTHSHQGDKHRQICSSTFWKNVPFLAKSLTALSYIFVRLSSL